MRVLFVFFLVLSQVMSMYDPSVTDGPEIPDNDALCKSLCPTVSQVCTRRHNKCMGDCILFGLGGGEDYIRSEMEKYLAEHFPNLQK